MRTLPLLLLVGCMASSAPSPDAGEEMPPIVAQEHCHRWLCWEDDGGRKDAGLVEASCGGLTAFDCRARPE